MKISYVTNYDPKNVHNWSGLGFYIANALEKFAEVDYLSNLYYETDYIQRIKSKYWQVFGKVYDYGRTKNVGLQYSKQIKTLIKKDSDILFSPSTQQIAYYESNIPKVVYGDATFESLVNFYPDYCNLSPTTIRDGNNMEKTALDTCSLAIYSSEWAARSAINFYGAKASKVKVVPFGANIVNNNTLEDIELLVNNKLKNNCNLLFIGVDWKRKGGEFAIKVTEKLNKIGINTTLHVVGVQKLGINNLPKSVVNHGFVSKSTISGKNYLDQLFKNAHFLIVPSRAEAYGLVFCEANAYGIPCLSTDVGGIPTIIKNNINGHLFSIDTESIKYVEYIQHVLLNRQMYEELAKSSFNEYTTRLNWKTASDSIKGLLSEI